MKFIIIFLLSTGLSFANKNCTYKIKTKDINVNWTAFKTPAKVGVSGTFKAIKFKKNLMGRDLSSLLSGVNFEIKTKLVSSNHEARDLKIYNFFFKKMINAETISGSVKSYAKKVLMLEIKMNDITRLIPMAASIDKDKSSISAVGHIDILDFNMSKSLSSLNKACFARHQGKTWNDIKISFSSPFTKVCK